MLDLRLFVPSQFFILGFVTKFLTNRITRLPIILIAACIANGCANFTVEEKDGLPVLKPPSSIESISVAYQKDTDKTCNPITKGPFHLETKQSRLRAWVDQPKKYSADLVEQHLLEFEQEVFTKATCLEPSEAHRVLSRVRLLVQAPVSDQVRFSFGYNHIGNKFHSWIDIRPGMRLCYLPATEGRFSKFGSSHYQSKDDVCVHVGIRSDTGQLTFEPFLAQQWKTHTSNLDILTQKYHKFGSPIDLQKGSYTAARLLLPAKYAASEAKPIGNIETQPSILAGVTLDALTDAINNCVLKVKEDLETCLKTETDVRLFTPAYRALWVPYIQVSIQGKTKWVSIGTTVLDVIDRDGLRSGEEISSTLKLTRKIGNRQYPVHFDTSTLVSFELPLVAGDKLQW